MRRLGGLRRLVAGLALGACAVPVAARAAGAPDEPAAAAPLATAAADPDSELVWDPFEPVNRAVFVFNDTLDQWVIDPVASGWNFALPHRVQLCISNFFENLLLPARFANDVLQAKPRAAFQDAGRFVINSWVGIGGLFDPASAGGIPKHTEDFGQTLGYWGVPAGPYLMLPILGPSSPRDAVGLAVDSVGAVQSFFVSYYILLAAAAVDRINDRAMNLEEVRAERAAALDFYAAVRGAYTQYRANQVRDRAPAATQSDEDLYYPEDDEEDER
jgi:phospholipid-binding lipoprotein MlaA